MRTIAKSRYDLVIKLLCSIVINLADVDAIAICKVKGGVRFRANKVHFLLRIMIKLALYRHSRPHCTNTSEQRGWHFVNPVSPQRVKLPFDPLPTHG